MKRIDFISSYMQKLLGHGDKGSTTYHANAKTNSFKKILDTYLLILKQQKPL